MKSARIAVWGLLLTAAGLPAGCTQSESVFPAYPAAVTAADRQRIHAAFGVTCRPWTNTGWDGWELESRHFLIRTTVRDEYLLTYMPLLLEDAVVRYQRELATERGSGRRMRGYLFSDKREWMAFTRSYAPEIVSTTDRIGAGGYQYKGAYISFYIGRRGTLSNACHEGLHLFWAETFGTPIPGWLNEGLAVQFEGHTRRNGRLVVDLAENRARRTNLRYVLVRKDTIPLARLITSHAGEIVHEKRNNWKAYYGQIWALYRFLRDGQEGRYRPALQRIIADCKVGRYRMDFRLPASAPADLEGRRRLRAQMALRRFSAYLPVPFEQFEKEYWTYARRLAGLRAY
jgi:hypothetical protein